MGVANLLIIKPGNFARTGRYITRLTCFQNVLGYATIIVYDDVTVKPVGNHYLLGDEKILLLEVIRPGIVNRPPRHLTSGKFMLD